MNSFCTTKQQDAPVASLYSSVSFLPLQNRILHVRNGSASWLCAACPIMYCNTAFGFIPAFAQIVVTMNVCHKLCGVMCGICPSLYRLCCCSSAHRYRCNHLYFWIVLCSKKERRITSSISLSLRLSFFRFTLSSKR